MSSWIHALLSAAGLLTAGTLVLFLLRLTLLAAVGHLALALVPRASAATRHLIASLTLAALVALPFATALLPAWQLPILPNRVAVNTSSPALQLTTADTFVKRTYDSFDGDAPYGTVVPAAPVERMTTSRPLGLPTRMPALPKVPKSWPLALAILVLAVSEAMLLRIILSVAAASVFARNADPVADARLRDVFRAARERLRLRRPVSLRMTPRVSVPVVSGLIHPTLLLPTEARGWEAERLNVVFLHELAHVQRCDTLGLLQARAAGALYWFHPFVRALVRDARRECELACDDRVLDSGIRASAYADHLLTIARGAAGRDTLGGAVLAIARRSNLERRLSSILRLGVERRPASRGVVLAASVLSLMLFVPLATVRVTAAPAPRVVKHHPDTLVWRTVSATPTPVPATPAVPPAERIDPVTPYDANDDPDDDTAGNLNFSDHSSRHSDRSNEESGRDWYSRAHRYYQRDRFGEAGEAYERAAKAGHNIEVSYYNAACSYALDHQSDKALTMLSAAVNAGWDDVDMLKSDDDLDSIRGDRRFRDIVARARSADPDESDKRSATAELEALRSSHSTDPESWGDAGVSLMHSGDPARAVQAFETQIKLGSSSNAIYNLACAHAINGAKAEALATLERAILAGYGDADHMQDDDDLASLHHERRFQELVKMTEDLELNTNPFSHNNSDRQGWREEVPRFEQVTQRYPSSGRAWFNLGYAQLRARDAEAGRASFAKALELEYRPSTTMYNLACCSAQLRDFDAAMSWLNRCEAAGMNLANYAPGDHDLDPLRSDARYRAMLRRIGDERWDKVRAKLKNL